MNTTASIIYAYNEQKIIEWGVERNILGKFSQSSALGQLLKTQKEYNEWKDYKSKDDIGDIFVTLVMVSNLLGFTVGESLSAFFVAYNPENICFSDIHDMDFQSIIDKLKELIKDRSDVNEEIELIAKLLIKLIKFSKEIDTNIQECIDIAWNDIKDRQGKMVHGLYVKQKDIDELSMLGVEYSEITSPRFVFSNLSDDAKAKLDNIGFIYNDNCTLKLEE